MHLNFRWPKRLPTFLLNWGVFYPPHTPYPPIKEKDTAFAYRNNWITVKGSLNPVPLTNQALVTGQWVTFIPFYWGGFLNPINKCDPGTFDTNLVSRILRTLSVQDVRTKLMYLMTIAYSVVMLAHNLLTPLLTHVMTRVTQIMTHPNDKNRSLPSWDLIF